MLLRSCNRLRCARCVRVYLLASIVTITVCFAVLMFTEQRFYDTLWPCERSEFSESLLQEQLVRSAIGNFQPVYGHCRESKLLVYSAWYDARLSHEVRVIGIASEQAARNMESLVCFYFTNAHHAWRNSSGNVLAKVAARFWIPHSYHPGSVQISCPSISQVQNEAAQKRTWFVSIAFSSLPRVNNFLPIQHISIPKDRKMFAVCVQPLHTFGDAHSLVEMIELNRLLGAQFFYFYNHSVTPAVSRVLHHYAHKTDFVQVLPWLYEQDKLNVRVYGQMASLADCQRRLVSRFLYMVSTDLDDFIIPRQSKTWLSFHSLMAQQNASELIFRNVFFCNQANNNPLDGTILRDVGATSLSVTSRIPFPYATRDRSKSIALAHCVEDHYIHFVGKTLSADECNYLNSVTVDPKVGLMHHYRCKYQEKPPLPKIEDEYVLNTFGLHLLAAIASAHRNITNA